MEKDKDILIEIIRLLSLPNVVEKDINLLSDKQKEKILGKLRISLVDGIEQSLQELLEEEENRVMH